MASEPKGMLKTQLARLEKSPNVAGIGAEMEELNAIQDEVTVVVEFLAFMKGGETTNITHYGLHREDAAQV